MPDITKILRKLRLMKYSFLKTPGRVHIEGQKNVGDIFLFLRPLSAVRVVLARHRTDD